MPNLDLQAAWTYHNATKHSALSIRTNPHFLDWANQPLSFKIYPTLEPLSLPRQVRESGVAAISAGSLHNLLHTCCTPIPRNVPRHAPKSLNTQQHALQTDLLK
jgi:hypothetical protein